MHGVWLPLLLQAAFFVVLVLEFILPSAGVLTAVALLCLGGSWFLLANLGLPSLVSVIAIADVILIPITLYLGFRLLQKSSLTNSATLADAQSSGESQNLVGKTGVAVSMLKPSGKVDIEGQLLEANSSGDYIEPGSRVRVLQISQNRITVEHVPEGDTL